MRLAISVLPPLVLAGLLLFASFAAVLAQDRSEADLRNDVSREWYRLAQGRTEFEVSDPALVPSQLALAAEQSGCRYKEDIRAAPVRFMRLEGRRLAIVFCFGTIGSHQVFDLSNLRKPTLVELPILAQPDGFGTTARPGWITWEKETGVFQAETGSDLLPSPRVRHTYRFGADGFVIVRVEASKTELANGPRYGTRRDGLSPRNQSKAASPPTTGQRSVVGTSHDFVERMPVHIHTAILDLVVIVGGVVMISSSAQQLW
jgi:hypothetical protein